MIAASLSALGRDASVSEVSKRDIWSASRISEEREDISYSIIAIDLMPAAALSDVLFKVEKPASLSSFQPALQ